MFSYIWPIVLVVISNTLYQICAKETPIDIDPFASLTVTYITGAVASLIMYYIVNRSGNILKEYEHVNWATIALGVVIVGLEVGFIYAYKAGWSVSTAQITQGAFLAITLAIVGFAVYKEALTSNKIIGIVICLVGLYFINK